MSNDFFNPFFSVKIMDGLFICNQTATKEQQFIMNNKFSLLINTCPRQFKIPSVSQMYKVINFNWFTSKGQLIQNINITQFLHIFQEITKYMNEGQGVLIVSDRGHTRALTFCILYLMHKYEWKIYKTLQYINSRRQNLQVRATYLKLLMDFQKSYISIQDQHLSSVIPKSISYKSKKHQKWSSQNIKSNQQLLITNTFNNTIKRKGVYQLNQAFKLNNRNTNISKKTNSSHISKINYEKQSNIKKQSENKSQLNNIIYQDVVNLNHVLENNDFSSNKRNDYNNAQFYDSIQVKTQLIVKKSVRFSNQIQIIIQKSGTSQTFPQYESLASQNIAKQNNQNKIQNGIIDLDIKNQFLGNKQRSLSYNQKLMTNNQKLITKNQRLIHKNQKIITNQMINSKRSVNKSLSSRLKKQQVSNKNKNLQLQSTHKINNQKIKKNELNMQIKHQKQQIDQQGLQTRQIKFKNSLTQNDLPNQIGNKLRLKINSNSFKLLGPTSKDKITSTQNNPQYISNKHNYQQSTNIFNEQNDQNQNDFLNSKQNKVNQRLFNRLQENQRQNIIQIKIIKDKNILQGEVTFQDENNFQNEQSCQDKLNFLQNQSSFSNQEYSQLINLKYKINQFNKKNNFKQIITKSKYQFENQQASKKINYLQVKDQILKTKNTHMKQENALIKKVEVDEQKQKYKKYSLHRRISSSLIKKINTNANSRVMTQPKEDQDNFTSLVREKNIIKDRNIIKDKNIIQHKSNKLKGRNSQIKIDEVSNHFKQKKVLSASMAQTLFSNPSNKKLAVSTIRSNFQTRKDNLQIASVSDTDHTNKTQQKPIIRPLSRQKIYSGKVSKKYPFTQSIRLNKNSIFNVNIQSNQVFANKDGNLNDLIKQKLISKNNASKNTNNTIISASNNAIISVKNIDQFHLNRPRSMSSNQDYKGKFAIAITKDQNQHFLTDKIASRLSNSNKLKFSQDILKKSKEYQDEVNPSAIQQKICQVKEPIKVPERRTSSKLVRNIKNYKIEQKIKKLCFLQNNFI